MLLIRICKQFIIVRPIWKGYHRHVERRRRALLSKFSLKWSMCMKYNGELPDFSSYKVQHGSIAQKRYHTAKLLTKKIHSIAHWDMALSFTAVVASMLLYKVQSDWYNLFRFESIERLGWSDMNELTSRWLRMKVSLFGCFCHSYSLSNCVWTESRNFVFCCTIKIMGTNRLSLMLSMNIQHASGTGTTELKRVWKALCSKRMQLESTFCYRRKGGRPLALPDYVGVKLEDIVFVTNMGLQLLSGARRWILEFSTKNNYLPSW